MISNRFKIGDSVSVFNSGTFLFKGVIYILGQIPLGKFYERQRKLNIDGRCNYLPIMPDDIYESAMVVIDDKNAENLIVLTMENDDYKLFIWNDLIKKNQLFKYERILNKDQINIIPDDVLLTEMTYSFK